VVVGQEDDEFVPERFAPEFAAAGRRVPVTIVPGVGHIELTTTPRGVEAAIAAANRVSSAAGSTRQALSPGP
jgi:non-heme chloroperoxidase